MAQQVKNPAAIQETEEMQARFLGWEDPLGESMVTHSSILAWRIHGPRSLVDYSPKGRKELGTTERLSACTHTHFNQSPWTFNTSFTWLVR